MFSRLQDSFSKIFGALSGKTKISAKDFEVIVQDIKITLLSADMSLKVVKDIIERIKEEAIGQNLIESVKPDQQIIKIVQDVLSEILEDEKQDVKITKTPTIFMMMGLQGSGKTTMTGKVAKYYKDQGKKVLVASVDIYRPAAQKQLEILAESIEVNSLPIIESQKVLQIIKRAHQEAIDGGYDLLIIDTAGRLHIDAELIGELKDIVKLIDVDNKILVVDSLLGQDAINIAMNFQNEVGIDSIALSRIDGDSRGGVAMSIRHITKAPIIFMGTGEKVTDFDLFHAERIAARILGKGDIVTLVEKAKKTVETKDAEKLAKKLKKGTFDMDDLKAQLKSIKKLGGIGGVASMLPGIGNMLSGKSLNENLLDMQIAVINAMTPQERADPIKVLNGSRKRRVAKGAGTIVQEVNKLLRQYEQMLVVIKKMRNMDNSPKAQKSSLQKLLSGELF